MPRPRLQGRPPKGVGWGGLGEAGGFAAVPRQASATIGAPAPFCEGLGGVGGVRFPYLTSIFLALSSCWPGVQASVPGRASMISMGDRRPCRAVVAVLGAVAMAKVYVEQVSGGIRLIAIKQRRPWHGGATAVV